MNPLDTLLQEFDNRVIELKSQCLQDKEDSEVVEFGYRTWRKDENGVEIFTVTDWGNIRKFITKAYHLGLVTGAERMEEKTIETIENYVDDMIGGGSLHGVVGDKRIFIGGLLESRYLTNQALQQILNTIKKELI